MKSSNTSTLKSPSGPVGAATAPFANPLVFLFLGGFLLAAAVEHCGLHRRLAYVTVRLMGTAPRRLVLGFMLASGFLSMWLSNTATVVLLLPVLIELLIGKSDRPFVGDPAGVVQDVAFAQTQEVVELADPFRHVHRPAIQGLQLGELLLDALALEGGQTT